MKTTLILLALLTLVGCGSGDSSGGSSPVAANETLSLLNGTWKLAQFHCYNLTTGVQTASALIRPYHDHTVQISGSNVKLTLVTTSCTIYGTGTLSYNSALMSMSPLRVQTANSDRCVTSWQMPAGVTPNMENIDVRPGDTLFGFTNLPYKFSGNILMLPNGYSSGSPGETCFDVYNKQ